MKELIEILPDIIMYLVSGYICVRIFRMTFNSNNIGKDTLIQSLIIGFCINNSIKYCISNNAIVNVISVVLGYIIGYLAGRILNTLWFRKILYF